MAGLVRRVVVALSVLGVAVGGLAVAAVAPASADTGSGVAITRASWSYIDVARPLKTLTGGDAPVGAWLDGQGYHSSKAYFTFDLTALRGTRILDVTSGFTAETAANDCSKPRATEMWVTDAVGKPPTWVHQPRELVKVPGPFAQPGCLWGSVEWDVKAALVDAVAAGKTSLTLELRMAGNRQFDPAYGRHYGNNAFLVVRYNQTPNPPTELGMGLFGPCNQPLFDADEFPELGARPSDPDQFDRLTATFAIWPIDEPTRRTELTSSPLPSGVRTGVLVPAGVLTDGRTYDWAVRASDTLDSSGWSASCRFTWDRTAPNVVPTVTSTDYPENLNPPGSGGKGIPGSFTFGPSGVADVAGYYWGEFGANTFVPADHLGGSATIQFTPRFSGPLRLFVRSVDRAGWSSPTKSYQSLVHNTGPVISSPTGTDGVLGQAKEFDVRPGMDGVVEYGYTVNGGPETVVPAAADGTAHFAITVTQADGNTVLIWSRTRDGFRSEDGGMTFQVDPMLPEVTQTPDDGVVGTQFTFTFHPTMPDVVSYIYQFDFEPEVTVPANPDGTATVTVTSTEAGFFGLLVRSVNSAGYRSGQTFYFYQVGDGAPEISSQNYPGNVCRDGVGVPGDFTFTSVRPNVAEFVYRFDSEPETVVPAVNGRATVTFTPDQPNFHQLLVHSRDLDGRTSADSFYQFCANGTG